MAAMMFAGRTVSAQTHELASWTSLSVKKNFTKDFNLTFREELRIKDNLQSTDIYFFRLTAGYNINSWLSCAVAYDYLSTHVGSATRGTLQVDDYTKHTHRVLADIGGTYRPGRFSINLRERYVYAYTRGQSVAAIDEDGLYQTWMSEAGSSHLLRSRLTVAYHIKDSKWAPYWGPEFYNKLDSGSHFELSQICWHNGVTFKVDQVNTFKFYYCCQSKYPSKANCHALGIDYIITLP